MPASPQIRLRTRPSLSVSIRLIGSFASVACKPRSTSRPHSYSRDSVSTEPLNTGFTSSSGTP